MPILPILLVGGVLAGVVFGALALLRRGDDIVVPEYINDIVVLHIAVPKYNEKTPIAAEQMFASLHGILRNNQRSTDFLSFELSSNKEGVKFYAAVPRYLAKFVEGQIYAQYPNAEIMPIADYADPQKWAADGVQSFVAASTVEFSKDFIFPIRTFKDFEVDPLAAITSSMAKLDLGEEVWTQVLVRPVDNYWKEVSKDYITAIKDGKDPSKVTTGFAAGFAAVLGVVGDLFATTPSVSEGGPKKEVVKLAPGQEAELEMIGEKMTKVGFEFTIRIVAKAHDQYSAEGLLNDVIASFKQFTTAHLNSFAKSQAEGKNSVDIMNEYKRRFLNNQTVDILNIEELASIYHLPNVSVETPNIVWSGAKKAEAPLDLPLNQGTIFAETNFRGQKHPFGIKKTDRRRHFYLIGKTGTGKSTLFKNMIVSDMLAGEGIVVVDPHGELVEWIVNYIPTNRLNDLVYFDPSDVEMPVALNLLEMDDPAQRDLIADGIVDVFKKQFGEQSWGPRLHYILYNAVSTILEAQGQSLLGVIRILIDKGYRKFILKHVQDPVLLKFWTEEFAQMQTNSKLVTEAIAPIQNKVGRFLSSATIRNIVGQIKSTIDMDDIINNRRIFLINLSQGRIGEESSSLLGGMIITRLLSAALKRVKILEEDRADSFLYVDEFQNFATSTFAKILSEARKYRLNLMMTHQYIDQLPEDVQSAVFGNVGTIGTYVVGPSDAERLAHEFAPVFTEEDLISLDRYEMYLKLMIDDKISEPFSANSLPVRFAPNENKAKALAVSRERYGRDKASVEDKIRRWSTQMYSDKGNRVVQQEELKGT